MIGARSGGGSRSRLAVGVVVVVLVVASIVMLRVGGSGPNALSGAAGTTHAQQPESTDVELARAEARERAPRAAVIAESDSAAPAASEAAPRRWRDLVRPVDALSGAELREARIAHALAITDDKAPLEAESEARALDDELSAEDLGRPGALVVDAPGFVPAIVDLARVFELAQPSLVPLRPSAAVRVDIVAQAPGTHVSDVHGIGLTEEPGRTLNYSMQGHSNWGMGEYDAPTGVLRSSRAHYWRIANQFVADRAAPPPRMTRPALPEWAALEDLEPSAMVEHPLDRDVHELLASSILFENVPAGISFDLAVHALGTLEFEPAHSDSPLASLPAQIVLEPGELRVIEVRLLGAASVRGALPPHALGGSVHLAQRDRNDMWFSEHSKRSLLPGDFVFEGLRPGAWRLDATWRDSSGGHVRIARQFELVAGATHDVGLLAPNAGIDVMVVPSVEIDGVLDPTFLGGALLATSWRFDHSGYEEGANTLESAQLDTLEPVVLRGVLGDQFHIAFDRPGLPATVLESMRFVNWRYESRHALVEGTRIDAVLCLATAPQVSVRVVVPSPPQYRSMKLRVFARRVDSTDVREFARPSASVVLPAQTTLLCQANLDLGLWDVHASVGTQSPFEEDKEELSWYAVQRIDVRPGVDARIELARAATVVFGPNFDWRGPKPNGWFQVVPVDEPDGLAPLAYAWPGDGVTHDGAVDGLAPLTEYRVVGRDARFWTGGAGSRVVLE